MTEEGNAPAPQEAAPVAEAPAPTGEKPKGLAIAGMITGICGCIPCLTVIALVSAIVGVVLSALALKKVKEGTGGGRRMAMAGLICGIVAIGLWIVLFALWGTAMFTAFSVLRTSKQASEDNVLLLLRYLPYC